MDRRDLLKGIVGGPIALAGVSAVNISPFVVLEASAVSSDMRVFDRGDGERFALTLFEKPWPKVGDEVTFTFQGMSFRGKVTAWETESLRGRVLYKVEGTVLAFEAPALKD